MCPQLAEAQYQSLIVREGGHQRESWLCSSADLWDPLGRPAGPEHKGKPRCSSRLCLGSAIRSAANFVHLSVELTAQHAVLLSVLLQPTRSVNATIQALPDHFPRRFSPSF